MANSPKKNNYIDPKGYWIDPGRAVRRMGNWRASSDTASDLQLF
jgi:hypothetical protein